MGGGEGGRVGPCPPSPTFWTKMENKNMLLELIFKPLKSVLNPCNARKAQMEDNLTHIFPELNKTISDVYILKPWTC